MATPSFFSIPGNIKQNFQPFVLKPSAEINKIVEDSSSIGGGPQFFTYKSGKYSNPGGYGRICFCPNSIQSLMVKDDISFKLLYGHDYISGENTKKGITVQDILNNIPGVQIREFLPDTRLDQCINLFTDTFKNMTKLFTADDDKGNGTSNDNKDKEQTKSDNKIALFTKKLLAVTEFTMKYMVGAYPNGNPSFLTDMGTSFAGTDFPNYSINITNSDFGQRILQFPFALYYRLQSCTTTNIYEIPSSLASKQILDSGGGMKGWTDGGDIFSSGGFRISGILGKIPVVGTLANMILGNIGINYMPWWNAESGSKMTEPDIEIKFDLFNDSAEAAMINYIFINTLVSGNKFLQYGMFQHSSNLYDVKIEGINRLFACAGTFTVTYEGVLRNPTYEWVNSFVNKYGNSSINKYKMKYSILNDRIIKIPDVYKVTMKFQSLLPASFNNYIYNFAYNVNHIDNYAKKTYESSGITQALPMAVSKYTERVVKVWDETKLQDDKNAKNKIINWAKKTKTKKLNLKK